MNNLKPVNYSIAVSKKTFYSIGDKIQRCEVLIGSEKRFEKNKLHWKPIVKMDI